MIFVVAGCYQQARNWAAVWPVQEWRFVAGPQTLDGVHNAMIVYVGSYRERDDLAAIERAARALPLFQPDPEAL